MANPPDEQSPTRSFLNEVNARLSEASRTGASLGLVLAVHGRVEPVPGKRGERWRLRTDRGHILTFRPEFVVAFDGSSEPQRGTATSCRRMARLVLR